MPWRRFIFTKAFWGADTVVYLFMAAFVALSAVCIPALVLGAPAWVIIPWWLAFIAFMGALATL